MGEGSKIWKCRILSRMPGGAESDGADQRECPLRRATLRSPQRQILRQSERKIGQVIQKILHVFH